MLLSFAGLSLMCVVVFWIGEGISATKADTYRDAYRVYWR